jgi:hypothetical protein
MARTKVTLAIHQRIAQREVLRQTHQGVVHRSVTMRMELAQHITHHPRRFLARCGRPTAHVPHGVQDARLHRLLAVTNARQGTILDRADGVLQVLQGGIAPQGQGIALLTLQGREIRRQATAATTRRLDHGRHG